MLRGDRRGPADVRAPRGPVHVRGAPVGAEHVRGRGRAGAAQRVPRVPVHAVAVAALGQHEFAFSGTLPEWPGVGADVGDGKVIAHSPLLKDQPAETFSHGLTGNFPAMYI